jgi:hypothetical protein
MQTIGLHQLKLSKKEWDATEIPVSENEREVLDVVIKGYHDVNIKVNRNKSLMSHLKLTGTADHHEFLYNQYFREKINYMVSTYDLELPKNYHGAIHKKNIKHLNSGEKIKIANLTKELSNVENDIFDFQIIKTCLSMVDKFFEDDMDEFHVLYYTLTTLLNQFVPKINKVLVEVMQIVLTQYKSEIDVTQLYMNSPEAIEKNFYLKTNSDIKLYTHQKELYTCFKNNDGPKLVMYTAPTGSGKTMSPLGLSEGHRIVFVCAARHVGLALAKAAISMRKKVGFAFGCQSADDIRLHYFAAVESIRDKKSGKILKVDNSLGDRVEIMICDIASYEYAMLYMVAFNDPHELIMYWDEPTITMDYEKHAYHSVISKNWARNDIPNIVLSSATLPSSDDLQDVVDDFKSKFNDGEVQCIISNECYQSIPLLNKSNCVIMPHLQFADYDQLQSCVENVENNKTLLRYIDFKEIISFVSYTNEMFLTKESSDYNILSIENTFSEVDDFTMYNIKTHYLSILKRLGKEEYGKIHAHFLHKKEISEKPYSSTIYFATEDSHTITNGPAIFLTEDVDKIAAFVLQSVTVPDKVFEDILGAIEFNETINEKVLELEKALEDKLGKDIQKDSKMNKFDEAEDGMSTVKLKQELEKFSNLIKTIELNDLFVPNKLNHLKYWTNRSAVTNEFSSSVSPKEIERIMMLDMEKSWKLLLMMGIGVFSDNHGSVEYHEIMKSLADKQKLFVIIASSDYIYGTNYQFSHGYISKDLSTMTQEKTIQAMGRIGRNKQGHDYSIRFRDDKLIEKVMLPDPYKVEAENLNKLLKSQGGIESTCSSEYEYEYGYETCSEVSNLES